MRVSAHRPQIVNAIMGYLEQYVHDPGIDIIKPHVIAEK